jgi:hypothetical protein
MEDPMVTFIYFFFMLLIFGLIFTIDLFVYRSTFTTEFIHLYKTSVGSGRWIIMLMWLSGLSMSILADVRLKKKKSASGSQ